MLTPEQRFWAKVDRSADPDGCWLWLDSLNPSGYGAFWDGSRPVRAHRFSYELHVGPIPDGLVIDHLCRVRRCVNPAHLEPVTPAENNRRGEGFAGRRARQTHCVHGHPLSGPNLRINAGCRQCRACQVQHVRDSRARNNARAIAARYAAGDTPEQIAADYFQPHFRYKGTIGEYAVTLIVAAFESSNQDQVIPEKERTE